MGSNFPCLPVPSLINTLRKLLTSAKPFVTSQEYCLSEKIINNFGSPGGEGEYLQQLILKRANRLDNWRFINREKFYHMVHQLVDWWQKYEYFGNRNSLVGSSAGLSFSFKDYSSEEAFLECASKIAAGALQFKRLIDENKVSQESVGDEPLDMSQYKKVFGTCRIPHDSFDCLVFNPKSEHITVAYKNNFYKVKVKEGLAWQNHSAIREQLKEIIKNRSVGPGIGILTSDCRDTWYKVYTEMRKNRINCDSIKAIEESLFLLCLDSCSSPSKINRSTAVVNHCTHGLGPRYNSCNRWFDKTLQFIVGHNGDTGVTYEESPTEIQVVHTIMNFISKYVNTAKDSNIPSINKPEKLDFCINRNIEDRISESQSRLERFVDDFDLFSFKFQSYGKDFLTSRRLCPDSYTQMAIQLAYYRLHQVITPQFQLISTRKFKDGRSDVIRCCSEETVRFLYAMDCSTYSLQNKGNALYSAIKTHQEMKNEVTNGEGIDKHLFGLKVVAYENERPEPDIFCTPAFMKSSYTNLNTYQMISLFDGFASRGPPALGYTCFYKLGTGYINFSISAFRCAQITNSYLFGQYLVGSLNDMREIVNQAPYDIQSN